ncbi:nucleoside-diphosphate sugar epimerase [Ralstonia pseudosolanacearum]|uniref:nucleoside-diphosphate sugar epimerase n=1 Tax=Ralstonia pseudosolanacearum TaxID=1310165 RepID=UPI000A9B53EA|nr:nucleoside-diphosphate sugar epimerase [Ralstonia pseudosolanacearum]MCL1621617.1 nucleoside-diphosphate sugar epimerase [Ralstonia pseudosolanacearum CaRs-Mep]MCQ4682706.1 nucleoside-diphosphate sugar epimerase [Ralstonia pseudosolanacearum]
MQNSFQKSLFDVMPVPDPPACRRVVIAGATGLVGANILQQLIEAPSVAEIHALCRRPLSVRSPKLTAYLVDFRSLPPLPPVDEVYLALGTTIKQAGSRAAFRAVNFGANLAVAQASLAAGATRFGVVSAISANARSIVFYNRVKGELEEALAALRPEALVVVRPSFLLGNRKALHQPARYGEKIGIWLSQLLRPLLPADFRPVQAHRVARALVAAVPTTAGKTIVPSGRIQHLELDLLLGTAPQR